jgi:ribosomal protein S18 acetylase RimI-like enzyme
MRIVIRPYRSADSQICGAVVNDAIAKMNGLNEAARRLIMANNDAGLLDQMLAKVCAFVGEVNGAVVGVGALDGAEIKRLYVAPTAQGQGVGRALLARLEAEAASRGIVRVWLEASPSSVGFYTAAGYNAGEPYRFTKGAAEFEVVRMAKEI